jgi:predicted dehydrogenase
MMAKSEALNVALIGFGYAGKTFHAPLICGVPGLQLAAVCSSDANKVRADYPSVNVSASIEELLAHQTIDVIVIATPNNTHFDLARRALLAGKHVVVDKPFTVTTAQATELKVLSEKTGLVLSVFHNRRWDADFLTLRALIASGKVGRIESLESRFDRYRPEVRVRWREQKGEGTGLWYDLGPHLLDQALLLFGCPVAIRAGFEMQRNGAQAVDYFHVQLRYEHMQVILHAGMLQETESPRYVLHGAAGEYTKYGLDTQESTLKSGEHDFGPAWGQDPRSGEVRVSTAHGSITGTVPNLSGDYRQFYAGFRDAILSDGDNPVSVDDAVMNIRLIELARESALGNCELPVRASTYNA